MLRSSRKTILIIAAAVIIVVAAVYLIVGPLGNGTGGGGAPAGGGEAGGLAPYANGAMANFKQEVPAKPVPDLAFKDGDGKDVRLSDFRGKLILLNLWATWCVPCREEMPALNRLQAAKGSDRFQVLALSVDLNGHDLARSFLAELKADHIALYNDPTARASFTMKAFGLPTTVLVSPDGKEVGRLVGPAHWDGSEAQALIEAALKAYPPR